MQKLSRVSVYWNKNTETDNHSALFDKQARIRAAILLSATATFKSDDHSRRS